MFGVPEALFRVQRFMKRSSKSVETLMELGVQPRFKTFQNVSFETVTKGAHAFQNVTFHTLP